MKIGAPRPLCEPDLTLQVSEPKNPTKKVAPVHGERHNSHKQKSATKGVPKGRVSKTSIPNAQCFKPDLIYRSRGPHTHGRGLKGKA